MTRRNFLKNSAFTIVPPQLVRGAGQAKLNAALVGCGGRGTGAATQLLQGNENVELVALADIFEDNQERCLTRLRNVRDIQSRLNIQPDRRFIGFDAYQKVLASDIDIVLLCTPPGYRPLHFEAAIEAGKHVFAEKPIATDPTGVRRFLAAAKRAQVRKLTVMSGAQRRSASDYRETVQRLQDGQIGEITAAYAWWLGGPVIKQNARDPKWADMTWQNRAWYSYLWLCGDQIVEQHFHNIDVILWVMGTHPEKVVASGGAAWRPRQEIYGHIYDHISAEFTFANGVRFSSSCRQYPRGLHNQIGELVVGSQGRSNCRDLGKPGINSQVQEHIDMVKSIRGEGPYINHGQAVAESTLTCIMARESAYSGQEITWDMILNSKQDLFPKAFDYEQKLEAAPLPVPGQYQFT
jgi:predicted dehydrogenase